MKIEQFFDKALAHHAYAIVSDQHMALIDPGRDPQPYYDFAQAHQATIIAVIETHPHADFISGHLEIAQHTGATIYVSERVGAEYPHQPFDLGHVCEVGKVTLVALNTPGHSPDSISVLLRDESGADHAVFTGDTLFVGDVGRPDLREQVGAITAKSEELARQLYDSTRQVLMTLPENVLVYPTHGAGSLCGKNMSADPYSTIGRELRENYALQPMPREKFVSLLLADQPFVPKYFAYNVALNRKGAAAFAEAIQTVPHLSSDAQWKPAELVIDVRPQADFKRGHLAGAINLQEGGAKFETWVGSVVGPDELFFLIAEDDESRERAIRKLAKIGYEKNMLGTLINPVQATTVSPIPDLADFRAYPHAYTIVDIRNPEEVREQPIFAEAINIPLPQLRERVSEVPARKPVMVHCAGGYRSAAGASILESFLPGVPVYDLSESVLSFQSAAV